MLSPGQGKQRDFGMWSRPCPEPQDPHTPAGQRWALGGFSPAHFMRMEFHFTDYTFKKKNLSVQYIYLPQDLVFPSAATFQVQEAAICHTWADEPLD